MNSTHSNAPNQHISIQISRTDDNVFEALACDSFALKDDRHNTGHERDADRAQDNKWAQEKPPESFMSSVRNKGPPILPPHLLQVNRF